MYNPNVYNTILRIRLIKWSEIDNTLRPGYEADPRGGFQLFINGNWLFNGLFVYLYSVITLRNRMFTVYAYRKTSNIRRTLVGNKIADNSDVVGASPVGVASTTSSFWT